MYVCMYSTAPLIFNIFKDGVAFHEHISLHHIALHSVD